MTNDQIIETAKQAGITFITKQGVASATEEWLTSFARLIEAAIKELKDAKLCDRFGDREMHPYGCAAAIRNSGGGA